MKKLYEQFFRIPEKGKISRRVMLTRAFTTAMCMILCLCAFCLGTHAYYTCTVSSEANTIQAASFEVVVSNDIGAVTMEADGSYKLLSGTYSVTMSKTGDATGYFDFTVDGTQYRTTAITGSAPITITIQNNGTETITCSFTSFWGTPDGATVGNNQAVTFNAVLPLEIISITDGETIIVGEATEEEEEATEEEADKNVDDSDPGDTQGEGEGEGESETPDDTNSGNEGDDSDTGDSSNVDDSSNGSGETAGESTGDDSNSGNEDTSDSNAETGSTGTEEGSSTDDIPDASSESATDNADTASTETTQTDATASVETSSDIGEESASV